MLSYILLLAYYSVCAVLAEYGWYRYHVLVRSAFFYYVLLYILCLCLFLLFIPLCVVLKGNKSLPSIQTKLHVMLSYYSVCAVLAEYCWYPYYVLVHSLFLCLFPFVYTIMCGVEGIQIITFYTY
jgi:hypothetical protein